MMPDQKSMINSATGFFFSTLIVVSDFLILLVMGIFFAASPNLYQQGVVVLAAPKYRERLNEVMDKVYFVFKLCLVPTIYIKTVSISPVMTLGSLVLFGILAGPLGLILATPLVAVFRF